MIEFDRICWADTETYCETPLKHGTHTYAEKVEVMIFTYAIDDGDAQVWDRTHDPIMPLDLEEAIADPRCLFVFQNSHFDRTVLRHDMGIDIPATRIHDTMVQALAHGLPGGLEILCEVLGVDKDKAKDKRGKELIQLFCKPRPKNSLLRRATRYTHPLEWSMFLEYAKSDILAMREIYKKLPKWNYSHPKSNYYIDERAMWELDQKINDRGVCMDTDLARSAIAAVDIAKKQLAKRTQEITFDTVQSTTQRDKLLAFILEAYGVDLPDMTMSTLERRINDPELPIELRELLAIRLQASTTSTSKYNTLIRGVSSDNRLRGCLQFCGAARTGRWAGRLFQPQNLPRPVLKQKVIDQGIDALKDGVADLLFSNVMELTSSCIRGCIVAPEGKRLCVSDLSNIEGRAAAYIAGEEWKLDAFRAYDNKTGHDLYAIAYAKAFDITPEEVMHDKEHGLGLMRQIGKVMELMLGYEGGVGAFITGAITYGIDLDFMAEQAWPSIPKDIIEQAAKAWDWAVKKRSTFGLSRKTYMVCDALKRMWREAHPEISGYWGELKLTVIKAINNKGKTFECGKLQIRRDGAWLRIVLPSGRALCYPSPVAHENGKISYMGMNQYSKKWCRIYTYGGKLFENICQAFARDIMAWNMQGIEGAGYEIILSVHDELLTEAPDTEDYTGDNLSALLSTNPPWAEDMPLAAGGFHAYRYRKD